MVMVVGIASAVVKERLAMAQKPAKYMAYHSKWSYQ